MFMWTEVEQVYSNDEMSFFLPKTRVPAFYSIPFWIFFFPTQSEPILPEEEKNICTS